MQGHARFSGGALETCEVAPEDVLTALDNSVAALLFTQVLYKTAGIREMAKVTCKSCELGALVIWDLSHSVDAIEVDLKGASADFAFGCGYKFLSGGAGALNIMRFGITPLYLSLANIAEAVERLQIICVEREWDRPEFRERAAVT